MGGAVIKAIHDEAINMADITIFDIDEADWIDLRDNLAGMDWSMQRGGGLDHSWAILCKGEFRISMEYDRWAEGQVSFDARQKIEILKEMPKDFVARYLSR